MRFDGLKVKRELGMKGKEEGWRKTYSSMICESFGRVSAIRNSLVTEIGLACHKNDRDSFATDRPNFLYPLVFKIFSFTLHGIRKTQVAGLTFWVTFSSESGVSTAKAMRITCALE